MPDKSGSLPRSFPNGPKPEMKFLGTDNEPELKVRHRKDRSIPKLFDLFELTKLR